MDDKDSKTLEHISGTLDEMLAVLKKPENRASKVIEMAGAVVSVLSILGIIEIVRNWIFGG